jgi:hypothetical protein
MVMADETTPDDSPSTEQEKYAEKQAEIRTTRGWTAYQAADTKALKVLKNQSERWKRYKNLDDRTATLKRFHEYAYQWY